MQLLCLGPGFQEVILPFLHPAACAFIAMMINSLQYLFHFFVLMPVWDFLNLLIFSKGKGI